MDIEDTIINSNKAVLKHILAQFRGVLDNILGIRYFTLDINLK